MYIGHGSGSRSAGGQQGKGRRQSAAREHHFRLPGNGLPDSLQATGRQKTPQRTKGYFGDCHAMTNVAGRAIRGYHLDLKPLGQLLDEVPVQALHAPTQGREIARDDEYSHPRLTFTRILVHERRNLLRDKPHGKNDEARGNQQSAHISEAVDCSQCVSVPAESPEEEQQG